MFLALAQLTNKAFTDAGKGRIRQSLTALVFIVLRYQTVYVLLWAYFNVTGESHMIVPVLVKQPIMSVEKFHIIPQMKYVIAT